MISGKGGFTAKESCTLFVGKSERNSGKEWRRERERTGSKTDKRGTGILKDAFRLNAADGIVLVKKRGGTGSG